MRLRDRVALITGASRGIGLSIVEKFLSEGAIVYANVRKAPPNVKFKQYLDAGRLKFVVFDVNNRKLCREAFIQIKKEHGKLDCLVNNAGILTDTLLTMVDYKTIKSIYDTNVFAVLETMSYAARLMIPRRAGSIINITSICGDEGGMRGQIVYSSSKGALISLTKTAAKELGEYGIRVNGVAPGFIDTDMFRSGPKEIQKELVNGVYLNKRVGEPFEVANVCLFLASEDSSYVNGENIRVDGFCHI